MREKIDGIAKSPGLASGMRFFLVDEEHVEVKQRSVSNHWCCEAATQEHVTFRSPSTDRYDRYLVRTRPAGTLTQVLVLLLIPIPLYLHGM